MKQTEGQCWNGHVLLIETLINHIFCLFTRLYKLVFNVRSKINTWLSLSQGDCILDRKYWVCLSLPKSNKEGMQSFYGSGDTHVRYDGNLLNGSITDWTEYSWIICVGRPQLYRFQISHFRIMPYKILSCIIWRCTIVNIQSMLRELR